MEPVTQSATRKFARWPEPPVVKRSEDYDHFGFKNNRDIDPNNLAKMRRLAEAGKFYPHKAPILVDRNLVIKDGQHRFSICQEFGYPVYYIEDADIISPEEIMDLNQAGKTHTVSDRLNILKESQTELGAEVRRALAFWDTHAKPYRISQTMTTQLLFNFYAGVPVGNALLDKTFKVNCEKETYQLLQWLHDLAKGSFKYDKAFINALLAIMRAAGDRDLVYVRIKNHEGKITAEQNTAGYKAMLLDIFNHGRKASGKLVLKKTPVNEVTAQ